MVINWGQNCIVVSSEGCVTVKRGDRERLSRQWSIRAIQKMERHCLLLGWMWEYRQKLQRIRVLELPICELQTWPLFSCSRIKLWYSVHGLWLESQLPLKFRLWLSGRKLFSNSWVILPGPTSLAIMSNNTHERKFERLWHSIVLEMEGGISLLGSSPWIDEITCGHGKHCLITRNDKRW